MSDLYKISHNSIAWVIPIYREGAFGCDEGEPWFNGDGDADTDVDMDAGTDADTDSDSDGDDFFPGTPNAFIIEADTMALYNSSGNWAAHAVVV